VQWSLVGRLQVASDLTLRRYGYDHVLSIEHEDALMSIEEGLTKAIDFLTDAIIEEKPATPWWV